MAGVNVEPVANDPLSLLDTSQPFDQSKVQLLDNVVKVMYGGASKDRNLAHQVLSELKLQPNAWTLVKEILLFSMEANTKFYALSILENCIQSKWKILTEEQKTVIKQCVTQMAVDGAAEGTRIEKHLSSKVNETIVQIVKQEWPHSWPNFMPEMCSAAKSNQRLCQSVMEILCILSEEVFEFGEDELTSKKMRQLMVSMTCQFQQVYELCIFVITNYVTSPGSVQNSLVTTTLRCLAHFLKWIPYGFIFQTNLIDLILDNFWEYQPFRVECVRCLSEIASLKDMRILQETEGVQQDSDLCHLQRVKLTALWVKVVTNMTNLPEETINYEETVPAQSRLFWEMLYQQLAVFLTAFLKNHSETVCEELAKTSNEGHQQLMFAMNLLVRISRIQHDGTFKICLDYWHFFTESILNEVQRNYRVSQTCNQQLPAGSATQVFFNLATAGSQMENGKSSTSPLPFESLDPIENPSIYSERLQLYAPILDTLRHVIVSRMAKPPEVYVNYDEETQTVDRDYQPDTDETALYNILREILVYLTNLNGDSTQEIMEKILMTEASYHDAPSNNWNPMPLNRLCWSIGAISGAMGIKREKAFLIKVIRRLLQLCEAKKGKDNKALVASQLMYIVGQYPRFLNIYFKFLQVLIHKLFEFMNDRFPGVQDMACETFLKVCQKCRKKISMNPNENEDASSSENRPLVESIITQVLHLQAILETTKQRLMLYEAVGCCIAASEFNRQPVYIESLLSWCNDKWFAILQEAANGANTLMILDSSKSVTEIIRLNERVAFSTGVVYFSQLRRIYDDMLKIYGYYSSQISKEVEQQGPHIMGHARIRLMRAAKRESLRLVETFVDVSSAEDPNSRLEIKHSCLPPLLHPVLEDYKSNVPQAKDYEVLLLLSTLVKRLDVQMKDELLTIFDCVFDSTLELIKYDFHSFPDIRTHFYEFLFACTVHCFEGLFTLPEIRIRSFVESLLWAFKHEQPSIAEQGLQITAKFLTSLVELKPDVVVPFFTNYYYTILKELVGVMTDTLHKSGLKSQSLILQQLVVVVDSGIVDDASSGITKSSVRERFGRLLVESFPNLNYKQVDAFVVDLFNMCEDVEKFQRLIRDFLVQLKEFSGADEFFEPDREEALLRAKIREEERLSNVPGMRPQWQSMITVVREYDNVI